MVDVPRGSDREFRLTFRQRIDQQPIVVSAPTVLENSAALNGRLSAELVAGQVGQVLVFMEGTDPIAAGRHFFRVQVTLVSGNTEATKKVVFNVV